MGQIRHGSASTTQAIRALIQRSQASIAALSRELGINPKTVAKWRKRQSVEDRKTGPKEPRSIGLSEEEEAMEMRIMWRSCSASQRRLRTAASAQRRIRV